MIAPDFKEKAVEFVIPRWLDYTHAVSSGELGLGGSVEIPTSYTFDEDYRLYRQSPADGLAADLLGRAFVENRPEKIALAEAVLRSKHIAEPTLKLAKHIVTDRKEQTEVAHSEKLGKQIGRLRSQLRQRPRNPTKWVDLARLYAAAGQDEKAFDSMRIALALAPEDRFTIRAFARLCIHTDATLDAIRYFSKNRSLLKDPWLLATAESLSKIEDSPSPLPKSVSLLSKGECEKFHRSELLEAFAMAEWMNGKERVAKRAFRAAWEVPSQSVIRHAEWFTRRNLPSLREETEKKFGESHEAASRAALRKSDVMEALRRCELWRFEEPYSVHPLAFESYLLCIDERFEQVPMCFQKAESRKLMSPMLFFNYLFATLMLGNSKLGEEILTANESGLRGDAEYFLLANQGLLALTKGDPDSARDLYRRAEELAEKRDQALKDRVFLHYCRAFLKFNFSLVDGEEKRVEEIKKKRSDAEIQLLIQHVERKLEERRTSTSPGTSAERQPRG
jgi:tetratricopeptide (TPR) repeat protein